MDLFGLLIGWWLPALLFYGLGLYSILSRRRWRLFPIWLVVFAALGSYTLYNGTVQRRDFEARAEQFKDLVVYAPPPAEVRRIAVAETDDRLLDERYPFSSRPPGLAGFEQNCATYCLQLLFGGRFDEVIVLHRIGGSSRVLDQRTHYRNYRIVRQTGCDFFHPSPPYVIDNLKLWKAAGVCVTETKTPDVAGPRFEVTTLPDSPQHRSWQERVTHIRLVGTDHDHDIARAEYGAAAFAVLVPIPGFFPSQRHGMLQDFQPGVARGEFMRYGPRTLISTDVVARVFGVSRATHQRDLPRPPS